MGLIMLVEDDPTIGRVVRRALRDEGHVVTWARTGGEAAWSVRGPGPDLVLLDLGLPDIDGLQVCQSIRRSHPETVVIMLTARRDEIDIIVGLESGADDYVTKPFGLGELLARVRAHLRRTKQAPEQPTSYSCDDVTIDLLERRCRLAEADVPLRCKEFDLLSRLLAGAGRAVSRETLMADVWGADWVGSTKTLDVHVASVRRKLLVAAAAQGNAPRLPHIRTLRGFGYRLEPARTGSAVVVDAS